MSDEKNEIKTKRSPLSVSSNDFVRFLEEKTLDSICPACKADEWTVVCPFSDEGDDNDTYRLVTPLRDGVKPTQISTFAIYCDNCGYIRQHLTRVVRNWANENPLEPELDFDPEQEASTGDE